MPIIETNSFVRIVIHFLDSSIPASIDCPFEIGANYQSYSQNAIQNGLLNTEGWFIKTDVNGKVWAFRLTLIHYIMAQVVNE